jgi:molecular chaperone HscB
MPLLAPCRACGVDNDLLAAPTHCAACVVVVEPHPHATPFARLGVAPPRFGVDDAALERAWLSRSRHVHPDRYARKPDAERRAAAQQTAALNDAWRAIRAPFDRAVWLVHSVGVDEPRLPQQALVEFMELREEAAAGDAARSAVVERCASRFRDVIARAGVELAAIDDASGWTSPSPTSTAHAKRAAGLLAEARTLARLVADLGGERLIPSLQDR